MKPIALALLAGAATGATAAQPPLVIPSSLPDQMPGLSRPAIIRTAAAAYVDGTYIGPTVDAYWGPVQVQAVVQNGQIVSLKMLRYPFDRRESLFISQAALPRLRDEVVKAQSAKVDVVSGATLTSQAFMRSLDGALSQARAATL